MQNNTVIPAPKLSKVLSLCVSGHRSERLEREWYSRGDAQVRHGNLKDAMHFVLQELQNNTNSIFSNLSNKDNIYSGEELRCKIISSGANGSEQIALGEAKELGYEIEYLLAHELEGDLDEDEYAFSLNLHASEDKYLSDIQYELRDELALSFADVLVAVWDDKEPTYMQSGTAKIVLHALEKVKPVVLLYIEKNSDKPKIFVANYKKIDNTFLVEIESIGSLKRVVLSIFTEVNVDTFSVAMNEWLEMSLVPYKEALKEESRENRLKTRLQKQKSFLNYFRDFFMWHGRFLHSKQVEEPLRLLEWIRGIGLWFSLMLTPPVKSQEAQIVECLESDATELTHYEKLITRAHHFFSSLVKLEFKKALHTLYKSKEQTNRYASVKPSKEAQRVDPIKEPDFEKVFNWSDKVASNYAQKYKDDTWIIYYAAAFTVFCAVAGALHIWPASKDGVPYIWVFLEFILLHFIVSKVLKARFENHHAKWMSFRFIAEQIRYLRFGFAFLVLPKSLHKSAWSYNEKTKKLQLQSAELWILQRIIIAQGLPRDAKGKNLYNMSHHNKEALRYIMEVLDEHKEYYSNSYHNLHKDHIYLHRLSLGLFSATFVAVMIHFFSSVKHILIFTAFFPAWGAAIHGILSQNEVVRVSSMASQAWQDIKRLKAAFLAHERHIKDTNIDRAEEALHIRKLIVATNEIVSNENNYWRSLFRHNHPELPA